MTPRELALLAPGASGSDKALTPLCLQLSNRLFEELAMDVYDEVDRRENDAGELGQSNYPLGKARTWCGSRVLWSKLRRGAWVGLLGRPV